MSTLAGAVGLGYVLGGGVPDFVVRIGGSMALRAASQRITGDVLGAYASASVNAPKSPPQADPVAPPGTRSTGTG
jgi:hypothetical protein